MSRFLLGINYWPRRSAMGMWSAFDAGEIDDDFARLAALGFEVVRFFLLWEAFQPAPSTVSREALRNLETLADSLAEHGLRGMPTLFTGHMSGVNWLPEWTLDASSAPGRFRTINALGERPHGIGDFYADPELLAAQRLLAQSAGALLRGHPALFAWDLGNEFSNLRQPASEGDAAEWAKRLTDDLQRTSGGEVTAGTHGEDLTQDRKLRLSSLCSELAFATMHGYPVYSDFARDRLDYEVVPFLAGCTAALARKPVLFSEFGNPTCPPGTLSPYDRQPLPGEWIVPSRPPAENLAPYACVTEIEMCSYAFRVLDRLQRSGALGAFWWCYADYAQEIAFMPPFDQAKHELSFGIVRSDGSLKPVAQTLADFARERREVVATPSLPIDEATHYAGLPGSVADEYARYLRGKVTP